MRIGNSSLAAKITEIMETETNIDDDSSEPVTCSKQFNNPSTSYRQVNYKFICCSLTFYFITNTDLNNLFLIL